VEGGDGGIGIGGIPELLQCDGDFDAIGCARCIEIDIGRFFIEDDGHSGVVGSFLDVRCKLGKAVGHKGKLGVALVFVDLYGSVIYDRR